jgi:hypothetical protein
MYLAQICTRNDEGIIKDVNFAVLKTNRLIVLLRHQLLPQTSQGWGVVQ